MQIRVLGFASVRDALGADEVRVELPAGATTAELKGALIERWPVLAASWPRLAVAVDGALTPRDGAAVELRDGAEVALLPPVSGGSGTTPRAALVEGRLDPAAIEARVAGPDCGAVLVFVGRVRDEHRGRAVGGLTYSAYPALAGPTLERIVEDLESGSDGPLRATIVHRLGDVPVGEASVVIAVASAHREAAYQASRTALERLKREVPIWKREHYADGESSWREEEPLAGAGGATPR